MSVYETAVGVYRNLKGGAVARAPHRPPGKDKRMNKTKRDKAETDYLKAARVIINSPNPTPAEIRREEQTYDAYVDACRELEQCQEYGCRIESGQSYAYCKKHRLENA